MARCNEIHSGWVHKFIEAIIRRNFELSESDFIRRYSDVSLMVVNGLVLRMFCRTLFNRGNSFVFKTVFCLLLWNNLLCCTILIAYLEEINKLTTNS